MTDRPILFSAPMIRALLAGTKTQTRRAIKPRRHCSLFDGQWTDAYVLDPGNASWRAEEVRFAVGDRLWVREAWKAPAMFDGFAPRDLAPSTAVSFVADDRLCPVARYRQAMHMPRWASRLTLNVTEVRLQRLHDCSEADAIAEGVHQIGSTSGRVEYAVYDPKTNDGTTPNPIESYRSLWEAINGPGAWAANPWVVAVSFIVQHQNIDALQEAA